MINIKILETPDLDYKDFDYKNYYDVLVVGRSRRSDLVIEDPTIAPLHFKLFIDNDNLLITTLTEDKMHINGKKFKGTKKLVPGDTIKFKENTIEIIAYEKLSFNSLKLEELYKNALNESPKLEEIVSLLERELLYLESKQNVQK